MRLLTRGLRLLVPPPAEVQRVQDPFAYARFFTPDGRRVWYLIGGGIRGPDFELLTQIPINDGWSRETILLSQLETLRDDTGLRVERDLYFRARKLSELTL
jgi:hypothetical protein